MAFPSRPAQSAGPPQRPPRLALIVAVAANGVIGARNGLPWHLPEDLKRFKALTMGHAMVMGRRTWASIGRALPGRQSIVVTRDRSLVASGAEVAHSLDEALSLVRMPEPVFCIGGADLFRLALPQADVLHVTEIDRAFEGDTYWAPLDPSAWREVARETHPSEVEGGLGHAFVTYERAAAAMG